MMNAPEQPAEWVELCPNHPRADYRKLTFEIPSMLPGQIPIMRSVRYECAVCGQTLQKESDPR